MKQIDMLGPTENTVSKPHGMDVNSINPVGHGQGITLREAALIAGFGVLIMAFATPFAELFVYEKLVIPGNIEATMQNITGNMGLFLAGIFGYFITFVCDVLVAWALYILLIPVNRSLSLLTAWLRLVYTVIAFFSLAKLMTVFRMLSEQDYLAVLGTDQLHAQIHLLLNSFQYEWGMSLALFGIHLGLLGYLVYRSGYIPSILGSLLVIAGSGWVIHSLGPYIYPNVNFEFLTITFCGELVFTLWLLLRGWQIQEPTTHS